MILASNQHRSAATISRLAFLLAIGGCVLSVILWTIASANRPGNAFPVRSDSNSVHLSVRLGWLVNANSAGQIVAEARGFYRDEGLEVQFREGGLIDPSVKTVAAGADDIGFANSPELVVSARAAGAPLKIVAVIHEQGYHSFFVRRDSNIESPRDWIGRRVGVKIGSPTYSQYLAIIGTLGLNREAIQEIPLTYDIRPFLQDLVDVYPGAKTNEALTIEAKGISLRSMSAPDYGVPTMGTVVFVTEATMRSRPDVVQRFLRATMRGWLWCLNPANQREAVQHLLSHNSRLDSDIEYKALRSTLDSLGDGTVDRQKLQAILDIQYKYGELSRPVSVEELVDAATSTQ